jgi:hypothetical protein
MVEGEEFTQLVLTTDDDGSASSLSSVRDTVVRFEAGRFELLRTGDKPFGVGPVISFAGGETQVRVDDGLVHVAVAWDDRVEIHDIAEGGEPIEFAAAAGPLALSPSGRWLVTGRSRQSLSLWDLDSRKPRAKALKLPRSCPDAKVAPHADFGRAEVGDDGAAAAIAQVGSMGGRTLVTWPSGGGRGICHAGTASHAALLGRGTGLKAMSIAQSEVAMRAGRATDGGGLPALGAPGSRRQCTSESWSADGSVTAAVCGGVLSTLHGVDVAKGPEGELMGAPPTRSLDLERVRLEADGSHFATQATDGSVLVWTTADRRPRLAVGPVGGRLLGVADDGSRLASMRGDTMLVWELELESIRRELEGVVLSCPSVEDFAAALAPRGTSEQAAAALERCRADGP